MFQNLRKQRTEQQERAKEELNRLAHGILRKLLPGQEWAFDDLSAILTRALIYTRLPHVSAKAFVESFFLVAPSGTGKTYFCSRLSATLNKSGASYFHYIGAHAVSPNPGRTIEEGIATKLTRWRDHHDLARKKDPLLPSPVVVVLVDEADHASSNLAECFRSMLEFRTMVLPPLKKGKEEREVPFPVDWAFLFIWAPNTPGDKHLLVQPDVPRLSSHPPDNRSDWDKVRDDIVKRFGQKAPSIMKRILTNDEDPESIILLYRLSGEAKLERCRTCLFEAYVGYTWSNGLNLRYRRGLEAEIAEWSEDRRPVFTQVRRQLGDAVDHLYGTQVSPGVWHSMDVHIGLRDGRLVRIDIEDADDEEATDALREMIAQHESQANSEPAAEPAAVEPSPAHSIPAAEGTSFPLQSAAASSSHNPFDPSRMIDSIEGSVIDDRVPEPTHWTQLSEVHQGTQWFPMSAPRIQELYTHADMQRPPPAVFDSVRKELSTTAAKRPSTFRWAGPKASGTQAFWYRTSDLYEVWTKHVQRSRPMLMASPQLQLGAHLPVPSFDVMSAQPPFQLQHHLQQQQQRFHHLHHHHHQQQHWLPSVTNHPFAMAHSAPQWQQHSTGGIEGGLPFRGVQPLARTDVSIPLATWQRASCEGVWFCPSIASINLVYQLANILPTFDVEARWRNLQREWLSHPSGLNVESTVDADGVIYFRVEQFRWVWESQGSSNSGFAGRRIEDITPSHHRSQFPASLNLPAQTPSSQPPSDLPRWLTSRAANEPGRHAGHVASSFNHAVQTRHSSDDPRHFLAPMTDCSFGTQTLQSQVLPPSTVEQASHPPRLPRRPTSRSGTVESAPAAPFSSAAGVRGNHDRDPWPLVDMHPQPPLPSTDRSSPQLLDSKRPRIDRSTGAASTMGFDSATASAVEKEDDEGDDWLLAHARRFPPLTDDERAEAESMMQDELREYHVPESYRRAMLQFVAPEDRDSLDLVRRLCASTTRRIDGVEVTLWDYRLLISADTVQKVAAPIRAYIDLLNVVTHVCLDDADRYMVVVDVPVLILLRRLMPHGIDGMSCIAFIKLFVKRGLSVAARRQPRSASDARVQCFQVVGQMLPGRLRRAKLCFQRFAEDGPAAVLYQFHLPIAVDNLPLERWDQPDVDHRLALLELGLLHSLSAAYLEAYQQPCAQIVTRASHAGLTSFSMFAPAAHPTAAFRHACVSSVEREELDRFVRAHDRDAVRHQAFDSEGHDLAQDCEDPDVHTLLQALHLQSQQQEDEALAREYETMQAREAEEDEALYQEHLADEQHAKAKRSRDNE